MCETRKFNDTEPERRNDANFKIKLLCRDDTSLVVEIVDTEENLYDSAYGNHSEHFEHHRQKKENGNLYMVKIERGNVLSEKIFYIVSSICLRINGQRETLGKLSKQRVERKKTFSHGF